MLISVFSRLKLTYDGNLYQEQLHLIFTAIIEKIAQVEKLRIAGITISKLSCSLFASAASNVAKLKLLLNFNSYFVPKLFVPNKFAELHFEGPWGFQTLEHVTHSSCC